MSKEYLPQGISITNTCYDCMQLDEVCQNCEDQKEANDSFIAHELVDNGSDIYRYAPMYTSLMKIEKETSNHDWTKRDGEFKPPIVMLQDGGEYDELWEIDDMTQRAREVVCPWCMLLTPKAFNDCQDCEKPLEHNVKAITLEVGYFKVPKK